MEERTSAGCQPGLFPPDLLLRPTKPEVFQLDGGGVLLVWKPTPSGDRVTYCVQSCSEGGFESPVWAGSDQRDLLSPSLPPSSSGGDWTLLSEEVTDSCLVVKDLPRGASYVFRVGCTAKSGTGPFSDSSAPVVMATHPEGERHEPESHQAENLGTCASKIIISVLFCFLISETHIPLIQTESLGSKVIGSDQQTQQKNYSFLSEINRWG